MADQPVNLVPRSTLQDGVVSENPGFEKDLALAKSLLPLFQPPLIPRIMPANRINQGEDSEPYPEADPKPNTEPDPSVDSELDPELEVEPRLEPSLGPVIVDPNMAWATAIPNPPPIYAPTMALFAGILAPSANPTNARAAQNMPASKVATITACILLCLMLGVAVVMEVGKRKLISRKKRLAKGGFRLRIPKFPDVRGRLAKGIECLSWNMENGAEMATRAEFDDKTWGTPMHAKHTPHGTSEELETSIITVEGQQSPDMRALGTPWPVTSNRSSCPPALGIYVLDRQREFDRIMARATPISLSRDRSLSRIGITMLDTVHEESVDMFVGQDSSTYVIGLDSQEDLLPDDITEQPDPRRISVDFTSAESMSTVLALTSAGMRSVGKRGNHTRGRSRHGSDASRSTEGSITTDTDCFSDGETEASSNTSISTTTHETDEEDGGEESDGSRGEEVFELKRVTDSMEVKKGVLLALAKGRAGESPPEMPKLVVSRPLSSEASCKPIAVSDFASPFAPEDESRNGVEENPPHPKMIAQSSSSSLQTMESSASVSVDLDDFPSPPDSFLIPSITFTLSTNSGPITLLYQ
jgi:hypothetical protein